MSEAAAATGIDRGQANISSGANQRPPRAPSDQPPHRSRDAHAEQVFTAVVHHANHHKQQQGASSCRQATTCKKHRRVIETDSHTDHPPDVTPPRHLPKSRA